MELYERIRKIREMKGLTLTSVAKAIDVSLPHYSHMERGLRRIRAPLIEQIAATLDVSVQEIYGERLDKIHIGEGIFIQRDVADLLQEVLADPTRANQFREILLRLVKGPPEFHDAINALLRLTSGQSGGDGDQNPDQSRQA